MPKERGCGDSERRKAATIRERIREEKGIAKAVGIIEQSLLEVWTFDMP